MPNGSGLGKINKDLVQIFAKKGAKAVGICGKDGETIKVEPKVIESADIGYFGSIKGINTDLIEDLIAQDYIPIIASIGVSDDFTSYNLKADDVAYETTLLPNAICSVEEDTLLRKGYSFIKEIRSWL